MSRYNGSHPWDSHNAVMVDAGGEFEKTPLDDCDTYTTIGHCRPNYREHCDMP